MMRGFGFTFALFLVGSPVGHAEKDAVAMVAGPLDADSAVVLVHDWFGVTPFYRETAENLGEAGYRVFGVDLYDGRSATTHQDAWALMQGLNAEGAARTIDAALANAASSHDKVAIVGFSMGAGHALAGAIRHAEQVCAAAVFYGATVNDPERLKRLRTPPLAIFGSLDGPAADNAAAFSKAADEAGIGAEIYVYPQAHHAFAQPLFNQGATYDPVATAAAWRVATDYLSRRLDGCET